MYFITAQRGLQASQFLTDAGRAGLRSLTFDYITQRPVGGWGYASFVALPGLGGGTHSYPLTVWLETGFVGMVLFAGCNLLFLLRIWRIGDRVQRGAAVGLFVAVWVNIVVEASLEGAYFSIQILLLLGFVLAMPVARPHETLSAIARARLQVPVRASL